MTMHTEATRWERLKGRLFHLFPHHWLSRLSYGLARLETPLKDPLVRAYIRFFKVDMQEAEMSHAEDYSSFNHFFTRELQSGARPVCDGPDTLVSPCDGTVTQIGGISEGTLLQAKNHRCRVEELLGGTHPGAREDARAFASGGFCSIYVAPGDYHRVHAPADVHLETMVHVPGRLFSVADYALKVIPRLYVRNERVACIFESDLGRIAMVMIGALNVGAIETAWSGLVTPKTQTTTRSNYSKNNAVTALKRGEEMGRFNFGSCVIVLTANPELSWNPAYMPGRRTRMGEELGCVIHKGEGDVPEKGAAPAFKPVGDGADPG